MEEAELLVETRGAVRLFSLGVNEVCRIDSFLFVVSVDAKDCSREAIDIVSFQKCSRAKAIRAGSLSCVELRLLVLFEILPSISHYTLDRFAHLRCQCICIERLAPFHSDLGETISQLNF